MKDLRNFFYSLLNSIAYLGTIPRLFYTILLITFIGITTYRIMLNPIIALFLGTLFLTFYLKDSLQRFLLVRYFGTISSKSFLSSIDPLSLLIPISYVLLNRSFEYSFFLPVIIWAEPLIVRRALVSREEKLFSSFLSSLIHLFFLISGVALIVLLQRYRIFELSLTITKFATFNLKTILSYLLFYFLMFNLTYLIMNMLPIAPFDMGVALEHVGKIELVASINNIGNILIFFLYYIDVITYISNPIYKFFIFKFLINYLS